MAKAIKTIKRNVKAYDNDLNQIEVEVSVDFVPASSVPDAMARLGDESKVLSALNAALQLKAVNQEIANKKPENGISQQTVNKFFRNLRNIPPYDGIEDSDEQTKRILSDVKANAFMLGLLRSLAEKDRQAGDDDETAVE